MILVVFPIYRTSAFNLLTCMSGHFPLSVAQTWPLDLSSCLSPLLGRCPSYLLFSDCPFLVIILHWYIWLNVIWLDTFDNSNLSYTLQFFILLKLNFLVYLCTAETSFCESIDVLIILIHFFLNSEHTSHTKHTYCVPTFSYKMRLNGI